MPLQVPCGKCVGCSADRALTWSIRMHHEASQHERNSFLTLTYKEPAPVCLSKRDLQLFFKRLRRKFSVRYFACGEYGTRTHRPHYHAVVFGEDFLGGAYAINDSLHGNPYLDRAWGKGFVSCGQVTFASCMYVAGYVAKKIGDKDTFNLMSRRPGIGHTWLDKYVKDLVNTETVVIEGQELPIPKRYIDWYGDDFEMLKRERKKFFEDLTPEQRHRRRTQAKAAELMYKSRQQLKQEHI